MYLYMKTQREPQIYENGRQQNMNKRTTNGVDVHNIPNTRFNIMSFEDQFDWLLLKGLCKHSFSDLPSGKRCPWYHIIWKSSAIQATHYRRFCRTIDVKK